MTTDTTNAQKGLKVTLILWAVLQLIASAAIYAALSKHSEMVIPAPWRFMAVLMLQAGATAAVAVAARWQVRRRVYAALALAVLGCVSLYFFSVGYVSGRNVNVEAVRHRVEGAVLIVVLCGFAVMNLRFAAGLPSQ
jgi:peptidoglycan/LPS O-acetylase OafA/YrhL